jgi:3,4-dihydroxy-9,10-secoandrosta-1,3,5(10)-triene-9,17-dione 4,5-dioxygenase
MNIRELGYVVLDTTNLAAWRHYLRDVVGAMVADPEVGTLRIRIDERDCRLLLREAATEKLAAMGWMLRDDTAYAQALAQARQTSLPVTEGTSDECEVRRVNGFFAIVDPAGHRHELAWGPLVNFRAPFVSPIGVPSFVTGLDGLGHLVITCQPSQYGAERRFIMDVLGLGLANFRRQALRDDQLVKFPIDWFHSGNGRQHSLGLAASMPEGVSGHGCRHINLEVPDIDDVGRALDRTEKHGVRVVRSLGRHVNDKAISFYMASPGGCLIEYGCSAPRRDWAQEVACDDGGAGSVWGHRMASAQP